MRIKGKREVGVRVSALIALMLMGFFGISSCTTGSDHQGDGGEDLEATEGLDPEGSVQKAPEPEEKHEMTHAQDSEALKAETPQAEPVKKPEVASVQPPAESSEHMMEQRPVAPAKDDIRAAKAFGPDEKGVVRGPGGAPAGAGLPEMGSTMFYVVLKGDTLGKIAQKIFGDETAWKSLKRSSQLKNANLIYPGDLVYYQLSPKSVKFAQNYSKTDKKEVLVKTGDSLSKIAKRIYGNSKQWKSLWKQNTHIGNPNKIEVGMKIQYLSKLKSMESTHKFAKVTKQIETVVKAEGAVKNLTGSLAVMGTLMLSQG